MTSAGIYYGVHTLLQLLPTQVFSTVQSVPSYRVEWKLPVLMIVYRHAANLQVTSHSGAGEA